MMRLPSLNKRGGLVLALTAVAVLGASGRVAAQAPIDQNTLLKLQERLENLERQNRDLQETVKTLQTAPPAQPILTIQNVDAQVPMALPAATLQPPVAADVRNIVRDVLKEEAKSKADAETAAKKKKEAEGSVVGTETAVTGKWRNGALWFDTADKSFQMHIGGRVQYDVIGETGSPQVQFDNGGTGRIDDATNFRRIRLDAEGTFWETFNFYAQVDFINTTQALNQITVVPVKDPVTGAVTNITTTTGTNTFNTPVPTDMWVENTQVPIVGNVRIGNLKPAFGFEHYTSSRFLNFLERSNAFDSFIENGNNGFESGMLLYNWTENQRATAAYSLTKNTRATFGWNVGDGEWRHCLRTTWLPVWEDNGRCFVHLGLSTQYSALDNQQLRLRSRTELRNGPAALHTIVALAQLQADEGQFLMNPEFVAQVGPFLIQSEFDYSYLEGVTKIVQTPTQTNLAISKRPYQATGGYVEVLYFLTGEHRDYNRKLPGLGRVVPYENAYLVRGENGKWSFFRGAWQLALRYSYLDQNNNGILGGSLESWTFGVNWFLNPNFKIQLNAETGHRYVGIAGPNAANGAYEGVGMRFAYDF